MLCIVGRNKQKGKCLQLTKKVNLLNIRIKSIFNLTLEVGLKSKRIDRFISFNINRCYKVRWNLQVPSNLGL